MSDIQKRFLDFILGTEIPLLVTAGFLVMQSDQPTRWDARC